MEVEWRRIRHFSDYSVSETGFVRNDETGRLMTRLINQSGLVNVGLTKNRIQYKRSVALLVATEFITTKPDSTFDCPINLDGDRLNNCVLNLMWRPRWFAVKYFQQFREERFLRPSPIEDLVTGIVFKNPWDAALKLGLLYNEVLLSVYTQTLVWPIHHSFCVV